MQLAEQIQIDLTALRGGKERAVVLEDGLSLLDLLDGVGDVLILAGLLFEARQGLLQGLQVGQDQLGIDHGDVAGRINLAVDVDHVVISEGAHHLADRVGLANVGQEGVTHALALGSALHDAGDVHEGDGGREDALRAVDFRQAIQARVRQLHQALVRLDRGEGVVRRQHIVAGQRVKKGGLADVRQANDSKGERHSTSPYRCDRILPSSLPEVLPLVQTRHPTQY